MGSEQMQCVLQQLGSHQKLDRDKGAKELERSIIGIEPEEFVAWSEFLVEFSQHSSSFDRWEDYYGLLTAYKILVGHPWSTDDLLSAALSHVLHHLTHDEYRVRIAAGELLGRLCERSGPQIYVQVKDRILHGILENLERKMEVDEKLDAKLNPSEDLDASEELASELAPGTSPRSTALLFDENLANVSAKQKIFHDTAGWKHLETWMKCLQCAVEGCGAGFNDHINQDLLNLIFKTLSHTNRFVRETGFQTCGTLVSCNNIILSLVSQQPEAETNSIYKFGDQLASILASGLADNWSQVRMAASQATRSFLLALKPDDRVAYFPLLLPRMCLNRYYVAEGVRIYSQDTWRQITLNNGKQLVERNILPMIEFYISQSEAENHAVREAACACIAELGAKISPDVVRPHVAALLEALSACFEDDSWPVRDAACLACGNFVTHFSEESRPYIEKLYPMFYENLHDNIPSVRVGAAAALCSVAKAYGEEKVVDMLARIEAALHDIESQPETSEKYAGLESGPATYGVVKRARDNDDSLHTDQTMYSCGSLAPKMGRGRPKDTGGCMHSTFRRACEPWEKAEGCLHLLVELSSLSSTHKRVGKLLPLLSKAVSYRHYTQHLNLLETLCKRLLEIAKNIGNRHFKPNMEPFFEQIFYSLSCDNALTSSAASQCLNGLSNYLGPNILRGRLEALNPRWLELLEANIMVAPM